MKTREEATPRTLAWAYRIIAPLIVAFAVFGVAVLSSTSTEDRIDISDERLETFFDGNGSWAGWSEDFVKALPDVSFTVTDFARWMFLAVLGYILLAVSIHSIKKYGTPRSPGGFRVGGVPPVRDHRSVRLIPQPFATLVAVLVVIAAISVWGYLVFKQAREETAANTER